MDFDLTPEQQDAAALARRILTDRCTPQRQRDVEATGVRHDPELWAALGDAGLLEREAHELAASLDRGPVMELIGHRLERARRSSLICRTARPCP